MTDCHRLLNHHIRIAVRSGNGVEVHEFNNAFLVEKGHFLKIYYQSEEREAWFAKGMVAWIRIRPPKNLNDLEASMKGEEGD